MGVTEGIGKCFRCQEYDRLVQSRVVGVADFDAESDPSRVGGPHPGHQFLEPVGEWLNMGGVFELEDVITKSVDCLIEAVDTVVEHLAGSFVAESRRQRLEAQTDRE